MPKAAPLAPSRREVPGGVDPAAERMLAQAKRAGLKLTPQRLAIVRAFASDPTHPTAQEIFERLRPVLPTMSFATVYNTLDALARAGLCAAVALAPGASRFDPNMAVHHHLVCDGCGLVRDVHPTGPGARDRDAGVLEGFRVRAVERIYRGLCAACAARPSPTPGPKS